MKRSVEQRHRTIGRVAPCVGAWIETALSSIIDRKSTSLPAWERGLKLDHTARPHVRKVSLPAWERGLKRSASVQGSGSPLSLPAWERGLKPISPTLLCGQPGRSLRGCVVCIIVAFNDAYHVPVSRSLRGSVD